MAPKIDPNVAKVIKIRVVGGEAPGSTLAQKVGPYGVPAKKVGEDIVKATVAEYKGLRVTVLITILNRVATIAVVPGVSSMVIKALQEPPRDRKKVKNIKHSGSISFGEVLKIARAVRSTKSLSCNLGGTVREVLGTCLSIGCHIDGKAPREILSQVQSGELAVPSA